MKRMFILILILLLPFILGSGAAAQTQAPPGHATGQRKPKSVGKYGSNPAAGSTFTHDGVKLYYEVYGAGPPLLLVHGNGLSIASFKAQIDYFRTHYRVIAMDSRDQGRSGDSSNKVTYEKMTDDLAALVEHLNVGPVYVLGWSDGGIEALLLGIRHPTKVKKIAAMAANLNPSEEALYPEVVALIKNMVEMAEKESPVNKRELKLKQMALDEPHIDVKALETIAAPTLILVGDHDSIREEHTVEIFRHIPNSQLCIFPNSTHMVPYDDPALFNATVDRFFRTPFVKRDRIQDLMKSYESLLASEIK